MQKKSKQSLAILGSAAALWAHPVVAANFVVDKNVWGTPTTIGSFSWAIDQANITPGQDSITLSTNVNISDYGGNPLPTRLANITDPAGLVIQGFGHSLIGDPAFITPSGIVHTKTNPQQFLTGDILAGSTYSFARIADNVSNVSVENLIVDGLNSFMTIGQGSTVTIQDSKFSRMGFFGIHPASVFEANDDSTLNLKGVTIERVNNFQKPFADYIWYPAVIGNNASLNMERSTVDVRASSVAGAISWGGGIANVVSSQILGQGLSIADNVKQGVLNLVNSVVRPYDHSDTARIQAFNGGVANVIASTIQFDASGTTDVPIGKPGAAGCPANYKCNGAPLQAFNGGSIHLESSAVSAINTTFALIDQPYTNTYGGTFGTLTADALSFVQPVATQDATAVKSLFGQPNLLTSGVPYALDSSYVPVFPPLYFNLPTGAIPLAPGPLLNVVADADGANKLINPIDGSVITTDVFGNPRTANGLRDVGAVQASVPGPLPVLGCGAAFGWSRRLRRRIRQGAS
ncbi:MAG: hypothetical protein VKO19_00575 [Cyanobacteriota bacterium]|nr:hypothetical protein [Cyanobacteriota bacterium]